MRLKILLGLMQIAAGMAFAWAAVLFLTVALATGDVYSGRGAFAFSCIVTAFGAVGIGVVAHHPVAGSWIPWQYKVLPLKERREERLPLPPLTPLGVALVVAPTLFIVGSIAYG